MHCRFRHDVGVQAVAKVDGVNVVAIETEYLVTHSLM